MKVSLFTNVSLAFILFVSCSGKEHISDSDNLLVTHDENCRIYKSSIREEVQTINLRFREKNNELANGNVCSSLWRYNIEPSQDPVTQVVYADAEGAWQGVREVWTSSLTWLGLATHAVYDALPSIAAQAAAGTIIAETIDAATVAIAGATALAMVCRGTQSSIEAYREVSGNTQGGDCGGYSVLCQYGSSGFWQYNSISCPSPTIVERDIAEDTIQISPFNRFGRLHNIAVSNYVQSICQGGEIRMNDSLFCITLGLDYELFSALNTYPNVSTNADDVFEDIMETFLSLPRNLQAEYYENVASAMELYINSSDSLLAWAIGGSVSILYYSSRLWIPYMPYDVADQYLVINEMDHSDISFVRARRISSFLSTHASSNYYIGIPVFEGNVLDRVYFFSSTPLQIESGLSTLVPNGIFNLPTSINISGYYCSGGDYPAITNNQTGDICVFYNCSSTSGN